MIKTLCLGMLAAVVMCGSASAEFVIDDFSSTVSATTATGVVRTVSTSGGVPQVNANNFGYFGSLGNTFTVAYDWSSLGTNFAASPLTSRIDDVPFNLAVGGFTSEVSVGGGAYFTIPAVGGIDITGAETVSFRFTGTGSGVGANSGSFGITNLSAVPEPTSVLLFGSLMTLGMIRRRSA